MEKYDKIVLDYETKLTYNRDVEVSVGIGTTVYVNKSYLILNQNREYNNRIVECTVIGVDKSPMSGEYIVRVKANGFIRKPYISMHELRKVYNDDDDTDIVDFSEGFITSSGARLNISDIRRRYRTYFSGT